MSLRAAVLCLAALAACKGTPSPSGAVPQTLRVDATIVDTRFVTRDHFIAGVEMQIAGEPFAEAMGRVLTGYSRDHLPTNVYFDPTLNGLGRNDPTGFSTAVETYEYSKQPMNNVALESGAGTSLVFGPLLNPSGAIGAQALLLLRSRVQTLGAESNATSRFIRSSTAPDNALGWPGIWPVLQPFASFDPSITATNHVDLACSISSDDDPGATGSLVSDDYECDYTTLHLIDREAQVDKTIGPGSSGWAAWKQALWVLNYLQVMHDSNELGLDSVPAAELANVGMPGNQIVGDDPMAVPGTFLGSSDIEGFQAGMFLTQLDNQAAQWLGTLTTTDGATLSGFASLKDALAYGDGSTLRWFPGSIAVIETADASGFPRPAFTLASPDSDLLDLAGLLGSFSSLYALTDHANLAVGGSDPALAYFDGDPFPADDQLPDGESTLHDRTLALARVVVANIDRLHFDPTSEQLVDSVTLAGGTPVPGDTLSIDTGAYALLALRTVRRAVDSTLQLYSNTTPDAHGVPSPLDTLGTIRGQAFGPRLDALIDALSQTFRDKLTTADGHAYDGWNRTTGAPLGDDGDLDSHSAAIRGLLVAFLATGDVSYRERALTVWQRIETEFYDPRARIYQLRAGVREDSVVFTPRRFGLLLGAMRDLYELVAVSPGQETLRTLLEDRVTRLNKLVLNGWDDRDQDDTVNWPDECVRTVAGLPRGGLQMAERTLSGETGSLADQLTLPRTITTDREQDCVPEISAAGLPSALADSITFSLSPQSTP
jgi:hypothetical protein